MKIYESWLLLATFLLGAALPLQAQAADITVDGSTCTLAEAITSANDDNAAGNGCADGSGADTITLQADVLLTAPLPQVSSTITIEGNGHKIDGKNNSKVGSVLRIIMPGRLTLNEAMITGGHAFFYGGGIFNDSGTVTLTNSTVSQNTASSSSYNSNSSGGGIYSVGGTVTLTNSTVSQNIASSSSYNGNSSGGGIYSVGGTVTLTNSTVSQNIASSSSYNGNSSGGGIYSVGGTVTLTNSTVNKNTASSLSSYNGSSSGGGIYSFGGGTVVTLTNSTVSQNTAIAPSSSCNGSSFSTGGGIYNISGKVILRSSIVSGNTAASGSGREVVNNLGTVTAASFNVFGNSSETSTQAFYGFTPGSSDVNAASNGAKPTALASILNPLANNGGPTQTCALSADSPAIDLDKTCSTDLSTDQRGYLRPVGAGCDAGAFEYGATAP